MPPRASGAGDGIRDGSAAVAGAGINRSAKRAVGYGPSAAVGYGPSAAVGSSAQRQIGYRRSARVYSARRVAGQ
jgi:hypothetical protein